MVKTAYIYQPHFMTSMFRVAVNKQQSKDKNRIVVTCSPQYNGVWEYDASIHKTCGKWVNGKTVCYEIPIECCNRVATLDDIVKPENRKEVIKQQKAWLNNAVKNRDYSYAEVPDWMVREIKNGVYR